MTTPKRIFVMGDPQAPMAKVMAVLEAHAPRIDPMDRARIRVRTEGNRKRRCSGRHEAHAALQILRRRPMIYLDFWRSGS